MRFCEQLNEYITRLDCRGQGAGGGRRAIRTVPEPLPHRRAHAGPRQRRAHGAE